MFEAKGWEVVWLKYGSKQRAFFERPHGYWLRQWIDDCTNAEYQSLLNADGAEIRRAMLEWGTGVGADMAGLLADVDDATLKELLMNLGGTISSRFSRPLPLPLRSRIDPLPSWPTPLKAGTSPLLAISTITLPNSRRHILRPCRSVSALPWGTSGTVMMPQTPSPRWIQQTQHQLMMSAAATLTRATGPLHVPETLGIRVPERASQGAFGHILVALSDIKEVAARLVTTSPDVAVSTNLANWINQRGIYAPAERPNYWAKHGITSLLQWRETGRPAH